MRYKKIAILAGIVLCCIPLMSACSFMDTLEILWNGEDKTDKANTVSAHVTLETANIDENVEKPKITSEMGDPVIYSLNGQADAIVIEAQTNDGGILSYQWYKNNVNSNGGGTLIDGEIESSFVPPTSVSGTTYYYVVVTNTLGDGIQMVTSSTKCVTVTEELAVEKTAEAVEPIEAVPGAIVDGAATPDAEGAWMQVEGGLWFVYPDGSNAVSKWEHILGEWFLFDENGFTRKGWYQEGDRVYYFDENGMMLHDTDVEGYHLGSDGVRQ